MKPLSDQLLKIMAELEEAKIYAQRLERWRKSGHLTYPEQDHLIHVYQPIEEDPNVITIQVDLNSKQPAIDQCMKKLILEAFQRKGCKTYAAAAAIGVSYPRFIRQRDRLNLKDRLENIAENA